MISNNKVQYDYVLLILTPFINYVEWLGFSSNHVNRITTNGGQSCQYLMAIVSFVKLKLFR